MLSDEEQLNLAYDWLIKRRKLAPHNADIWDVRFRWNEANPKCIKSDFLRSLQRGTYRLSPMLQVGKKGIILWSALDALALKWVELGIRDVLPLHQRCEHIKGHGGGVSSAHRLQAIIQQGHYQYVCRTDIKGYYGAIDKTLLQSQLEKQVKRPAYLSLLVQYLQYTVEHGGLFYTPSKGIPRGCSLSPLMGAFHLWAIDEMFSKLKLHYIRYMDDFIILTKTRHQLRKAVKLLNIFFSDMGFKKHPDKTFIGRISKGFDWMGAWLNDKGITGIAPRALQNHLQRIRQLYEQTRNMPTEKQAKRVSQYRKRWCRWAMSCLNQKYNSLARLPEFWHVLIAEAYAN